MLTIALPKGRLQGPALARFAAAGLVPEEEPGSSRKLIVPARAAPGRSEARFLVLKDGDVPLYVERGAADLGVCGLDQLLETGADVLAPIDFGFGRCRLCLAAPRERVDGKSQVDAGKSPVDAGKSPVDAGKSQVDAGKSPADAGKSPADALPQGGDAAFLALADGAQPGRSLRVATKYPRLAARAFARRGVPVDLLRLSGSVELAAVAGLADAIVDLVESGRTLEENGLVVAAELLQVSARLVVNRASYRLKLEELLPLLARLDEPLTATSAARPKET